MAMENHKTLIMARLVLTVAKKNTPWTFAIKSMVFP